MDVATGAMNTLLPKLCKLLVGEYKLQKGVKKEIEELQKELASIMAVLCRVSKVPEDQLDELVKIWTNDVRELSYDIEDAIDTFMMRSKVYEHTKRFSFKGLIDRATDLYKKAKNNHGIHNVIKDIMDQVKKASERRNRYMFHDVVAERTVTIDPRLGAMYRKVTELIGLDSPKNELVKRLMAEGSAPGREPKIVSIVGFGGLGKTTLANAVLHTLKGKFDCHVFVSVSLNPDIKMILKNILGQLDKINYTNISDAWDIMQLIDKIAKFLEDKRYISICSSQLLAKIISISRVSTLLMKEKCSFQHLIAFSSL